MKNTLKSFNRNFLNKKNNLFKTNLLTKNFSFLVANCPQIAVYVRKEYLTQFESGHGEVETGRWVTVKSKRERAVLFETILPEFGALYDKLPISAFLWKEDVDYKNLLPLDYLQLWSCISYDISIIEKSMLKNGRCKVLMKDGKFYEGEYLFTIDWCHYAPEVINVSQSEEPAEHKSGNIIKLDNGQFACQPNNRILWIGMPSLIPVEKKKPYFKVTLEDYCCERTSYWDLANTEEYYYATESEKKVMEEDERLAKEEANKI